MSGDDRPVEPITSSAASGPPHLPGEFGMIARFVVASVVLLAAGFCAADDKKDDKDLLQGEWVVVSAEIAGKEFEALKGQKLVVKGDEWTAPTAGTREFKFRLD